METFFIYLIYIYSSKINNEAEVLATYTKTKPVEIQELKLPNLSKLWWSSQFEPAPKKQATNINFKLKLSAKLLFSTLFNSSFNALVLLSHWLSIFHPQEIIRLFKPWHREAKPMIPVVPKI